MIRPRLSKVPSGTKLTTDLVNGIINRTEYAADLLRQYKLTAGNGMYIEPHYDGTRISYLQKVSGGSTPTQPTTPATPASPYDDYILPSVPSVNDVFLVLDKPFEFPGEVLGGLYARDLPLNQRQKIVYPKYVLNGTYDLIYSDGYWANFDYEPNANGLYPALSGLIVPPYSGLRLGGSNGYPSYGPHPNAGSGNGSFFFGGFMMLVKA